MTTAVVQGALEVLEAQLAATPRASHPFEHASLAYRLGLAYAESHGPDPAQRQRQALTCYEVASVLFDPRFDPVEHARVLNAAGAAHRALGHLQKAVALFREAAALFDGRNRPDEQAAALNNVGLVRIDQGDPDGAVAAFDAALELFDVTNADGRRGRLATLHNRGLAHASRATEPAWELALLDYERARTELDVDEAPYHHGLVHHSIGLACTALAGFRTTDRDEILVRAVGAFEECLTVFVRSAFPYQHGLAKHNLGVAWAVLGRTRSDPQALRRALARFEDATATLDPRLHGEAWQRAYANLERVEGELASVAPGASRVAQFVRLVAASSSDERATLVRDRLLRLLGLPEMPRRAALTDMALAIAQLGHGAAAVIDAEFAVLMELPNDALEVALRAHHDALQRLPEELREEADLALDKAIGEALGGPQRLFVRDFLYSLGWERP